MLKHPSQNQRIKRLKKKRGLLRRSKKIISKFLKAKIRLAQQLGRLPTDREVSLYFWGPPVRPRKFSYTAKYTNHLLKVKQAASAPVGSSFKKKHLAPKTLDRMQEFEGKCFQFYNLFKAIHGESAYSTTKQLARNLGLTVLEVKRITYVLRHTGCLRISFGPLVHRYELIDSYKPPLYSRAFYEARTRELGSVPNTSFLHEAQGEGMKESEIAEIDC